MERSFGELSYARMPHATAMVLIENLYFAGSTIITPRITR